MDIYKPNALFDYDKITLANPQPVQGGSYFTRITMDNDKPMYVQFPKCSTKQAIVSTKRGKYCDLMYERGRHEELIHWIENLESACQDKIVEKKSLWFHSDLSRDDIESMMSPVARLFKAGKYLLIRTYISTSKQTGLDKCMAYDEDEVNVDINTIESDRNIIPLVHIDGIKFSSRSFEIDIKLTQLMVIDKTVELTKTCLIKRTKLDKMNNAPLSVAVLENPASDPAPALEIFIPPVEPGEDGKSDSIIKKDEIDMSTPVDENAVSEIESPGTEYNNIEDNSSNQEEHLEKLDVTSGLDTKIKSKVDDPQISSNKEQTQENNLAPNLAEPSIKDDLSNDTNPPPSSLESQDLGNLGNLDKLDNDLETNVLEEINLEPDDLSESITLKKPNEVYYEIYKSARQKAKHMRQVAVEAYLEAKQIKSKYMLSDIEDSDDDMDFISGDDETTHSDLEEN